MKLLDLIRVNLEKAAACSFISNRGRTYKKCQENSLRDYIFSKTLQLELYEKIVEKDPVKQQQQKIKIKTKAAIAIKTYKTKCKNTNTAKITNLLRNFKGTI